MGTAAYNERMRRHYETFVSEDDFRRMAQIGLNAVRLPVPWYAFGSQESDASYISVVDYIDRAIEWAAKYNIRVLLDLATVPGGQGDSNDSPTTPEVVAEWHSSTNGRHVALDVLERLADRYGEAESLLGIELLDTPQMSVRKSLFTVTGRYSGALPAHYIVMRTSSFVRICPGTRSSSFPLRDTLAASGSILCAAPSTRTSTWTFTCTITATVSSRYSRAPALTMAISRNKRELKKRSRLGSPFWWANGQVQRSFANSSVTPEGRNAYERVFIANQLASFAPAAGWFFQNVEDRETYCSMGRPRGTPARLSAA